MGNPPSANTVNHMEEKETERRHCMQSTERGLEGGIGRARCKDLICLRMYPCQVVFSGQLSVTKEEQRNKGTIFFFFFIVKV